MTQRTLTFKSEFVELVPENEAMFREAELKSKMMRKGYIYKNFRSMKVVRLSAVVAKANWSREVREKRQKEVNEMPEPKTVFVSRHFKTKK